MPLPQKGGSPITVKSQRFSTFETIAVPEIFTSEDGAPVLGIGYATELIDGSAGPYGANANVNIWIPAQQLRKALLSVINQTKRYNMLINSIVARPLQVTSPASGAAATLMWQYSFQVGSAYSGDVLPCGSVMPMNSTWSMGGVDFGYGVSRLAISGSQFMESPTFNGGNVPHPLVSTRKVGMTLNAGESFHLLLTKTGAGSPPFVEISFRIGTNSFQFMCKAQPLAALGTGLFLRNPVASGVIVTVESVTLAQFQSVNSVSGVPLLSSQVEVVAIEGAVGGTTVPTIKMDTQSLLPAGFDFRTGAEVTHWGAKRGSWPIVSHFSGFVAPGSSPHGDSAFSSGLFDSDLVSSLWLNPGEGLALIQQYSGRRYSPVEYGVTWTYFANDPADPGAIYVS